MKTKRSKVDDLGLHKGEYPVYDVSIRVWDESCLERIDHDQIHESAFIWSVLH